MGDGSEEYLRPATHSHCRRMMRAGGEKFDFLMCFLVVHGDLTETGLQGELQTCDVSLRDAKMSNLRIYLPRDHWLEIAALPCARPGIIDHAAQILPGHQHCLNVCQGFFMRKMEER